MEYEHLNAAIRCYIGRLHSIPGITVSKTTWGGCTRGEAKKLEAAINADVAKVMREIGGTNIRWRYEGPNDEIEGVLRIPNGPELLKFGFEHYAKRREEFAFPADDAVAIVDYHNDQASAWVVVRDGATAIHVASRGEEAASKPVATSFLEYVTRGLDAGFVSYWGFGEQSRREVDRWRSLPLDKRTEARVEEVEEVTLDEAKTWVKETIKSELPVQVKQAKEGLKRLPKLASRGLTRLTITVVAPKPWSYGDHAIGALLDAPGAEAFRLACEATGSDPRFDRPRSWLPPDGFVALRPVSWEAGEPSTLRAEAILATDLVPTGLAAGATFSTVTYSAT